MKKAVSILALIVVFLGVLCACAPKAQRQTQDVDKLLYERGDKLIGLMAEMAVSNDYVSLLGASASLSNAVAKISDGDYSAPAEVYKVTVPDAVTSALLQIYGGEASNLTDRLRAEVGKRFIGSTALRLNSAGGAETVAAASVLSASDSFLCEGLDSSVIYVYLFTDGTPVMVTFLPNEENIVSASGSFVASDALRGAGAEEIANLLESGANLTDCSVEQLQIG